MGLGLGFALSPRRNLPSPPSHDEAAGLYHTLNRENLRATIFHMDANLEAFEWILHQEPLFAIG